MTEKCLDGEYKYRFEKDYGIRKLVLIAKEQNNQILVITAYWTALNA